MSESREAARLRASEQSCELFIARGTTHLPISEIAETIGISQRTFHRYFPAKAECVSPLFDWTTRRFNDAIIEADPDEAPYGVVRSAFRAGLAGGVADRTQALFPLVFADAEMWSVFLRKVHDGERTLAPALAPRLGFAAESVSARAAAAAVASATRIALEAMVTVGADAEDVFLQTVSAFAAGALPAADDLSRLRAAAHPVTRQPAG
ncbi:MAG: TetR/AcrR family transcriptional regulator [Microbacterium gubbeenense]